MSGEHINGNKQHKVQYPVQHVKKSKNGLSMAAGSNSSSSLSITCCLIAIIDPNEYRRKNFLFYTTAKAFNIFLNFVNNPDLENLPKDSEMVIFLSLATFLVFLVYKVPCELPDISNPLGYKWYEYDLNLYLE